MPSKKRAKKSRPVRKPKTGFFFLLLALASAGQFFLSQNDKPFTLLIGLFLFAAALWQLRKFSFPSVNPQNPHLTTGSETLLFFLILGLGFFFRDFRILSLPVGMHTDQGLTGLSALRILHEGWRPLFEALNYQVPEPLLFYQLAGWFGVAGSSYLSFHLFFNLLSLAAFPFIYLVFRQLAGQRVALLSLFLLAVMRWNWIETRNGYPSIQVSLYLFGFLALWIYGLRVRKNWPFYLSALFVGFGLYTYQAFKAVPFLILIYILYEYFTRWKETKVRRPNLWLCLVMVLALAAPLLYYYGKNKTLGNRERDAFIGTQIASEQSLKPLWNVWMGTALMFNREGDQNPRHNIPGRRMLDDVTGVLFILGLGLAWRARKKREGFYPLAGFVVMSLPGLLSTDAAHSNRLVCLTPFVAYFGALGGMSLFNKAQGLWKENTKLPAQAFLVLAVIASLNAHAYFVKQAGDARCREAFDPAPTALGRTLESARQKFPGQARFFGDASLLQNNTAAFLSYPVRREISEFRLADWTRGNFPRDKTAVLFLDSKKRGILDFLKIAFPGMDTSAHGNSLGQVFFYAGTICQGELEKFKPWNRGLKGVYFHSASWDKTPLAVEWDPVLNLTSKRDFPFTQLPPFRIRWAGSLEIVKSGGYQFQFLTSDRAKLWVDGRPVVPEKTLSLVAGSHPMRINFEKDSGNDLALNFIWKKPLSEKWEVVPASAFGKIIR